MSDLGSFSTSRKLSRHPDFLNAPVAYRCVLSTILDYMSYQECDFDDHGTTVNVKPFQLVCSVRQLATWANVPQTTVVRSLSKFCSCGILKKMVEQQKMTISLSEEYQQKMKKRNSSAEQLKSHDFPYETTNQNLSKRNTDKDKGQKIAIQKKENAEQQKTIDFPYENIHHESSKAEQHAEQLKPPQSGTDTKKINGQIPIGETQKGNYIFEERGTAKINESGSQSNNICLKEVCLEMKIDKDIAQTPSAPRKIEICFSFESRRFENIEQRDFDVWKELYPAVNIPKELLRMAEWCLGKPKNAKSKKLWRKFITNWLSNANEKAVDKSAHNFQKKKFDPNAGKYPMILPEGEKLW